MNECKLLIQSNIVKNKSNQITTLIKEDKYNIIEHYSNVKIVSTILDENSRTEIYKNIFNQKISFFNLLYKIKKKSNTQIHLESIVKSYQFAHDKYLNGEPLETCEKNIINEAYTHLINNNLD